MTTINLETLTDEELRNLVADGQQILDKREYEAEMKRKKTLISNLRNVIEEILSYGYIVDITNESDPNYWLRLNLDEDYIVNLE